jgi:hypothetical protein
MGPQGWRVAGLDLGVGPFQSSSYVTVLLEAHRPSDRAGRHAEDGGPAR